MRRIISLFVIALVLAGCGDRMIAVPKEVTAKTELVRERDLTDAQKITLLRHEAHKRELRWRVFCTEREKGQQFLAEAEKNVKGTESFILYLEDGGQPSWSEWGSTQADAAYNLYQLLLQNGEPNYPGQHKPKPYLNAGKICPPELKGE